MFRFSEKNLILKLQNESTKREAFNIIVIQYKEKLYWYIRKMVIDYDDAKDITQNVFLKAWENLDDFQFQSTIYTWLYKIATNESLNHLKKKANRLKIPLE